MSTPGQITLAVTVLLAVVGLVSAFAWQAWSALNALWRAYRRRDREQAYHKGYMEGLEVGSGSAEAMKRIELRKKRFGR